MSILLVVAGFAAGLTIGLAILAYVVARNRARIARLERRQRAHELVIRHLAEGISGSDDPQPPGTRTRRAFKGAAVVTGLALLVRRHPVRASVAAGAAATVAALAVIPAVAGAPSGASAQPVGPASSKVPSSVQAPGSAAASPAASTVAPSRPAGTAMPVPSGSTTGAASSLRGAPPTVPGSPSTAPSTSAPGASQSPVPVPPSPSPVPSASGSPSASPTGTCTLEVVVSPLLRVCVLV